MHVIDLIVFLFSLLKSPFLQSTASLHPANLPSSKQ